MTTPSRIPVLQRTMLLLLLLSSQHPVAWARTNSGRPSLTANPLLGVFSQYPQHQYQQHGRRSKKSASLSFHDVLLCTDDEDDDDCDDLRQVRSLALSSRVEQTFFRHAESALLGKECNSGGFVSECKSVKAAAAPAPVLRPPLVFWENMVCGAISRSIAQTVMHPANTMKTILQSSRAPPSVLSMLQPGNFRRLTVGAGANFILSVPHGAVNFAVLEFVRAKMALAVPEEATATLGPALDFLSSCISTVCCSVVSTPQMMITDNIMAGNYGNLLDATKGLYQNQGIAGFYSGWFPGLAGKIPSYALTWTLFQQLKAAHRRTFHGRTPRGAENSIMGCVASGATVCIMIPVDTIKTRLVTQGSRQVVAGSIPYKGIIDCAVRIYREEGMRTFYRGLAPRLISVVPMIGIQFGVYEYMKRLMQERRAAQALMDAGDHTRSSSAAMPSNRHHQQLLLFTMEEEEAAAREATNSTFQETTMEVAADSLQPFPAPHFAHPAKPHSP